MQAQPLFVDRIVAFTTATLQLLFLSRSCEAILGRFAVCFLGQFTATFFSFYILYYTQFAIQDSRLFGPNPLNILAPPSNYLSTKGFWATQPLEQIFDSEFLLCELGVRG